MRLGTKTGSLIISSTRLLLLNFLAQQGETSWKKTPPRCTNRSWRPMVDAGLISAEYKARDWREQKDWYFRITDAGRAAAAKANEEKG